MMIPASNAHDPANSGGESTATGMTPTSLRKHLMSTMWQIPSKKPNAKPPRLSLIQLGSSLACQPSKTTRFWNDQGLTRDQDGNRSPTQSWLAASALKSVKSSPPISSSGASGRKKSSARRCFLSINRSRRSSNVGDIRPDGSLSIGRYTDTCLVCPIL